MASLVTEVLLQAGKLDKVGLQTRVTKLTSKSSELKSKVDDYVKKKYSEFNPMFFTCQTLLSDIKEQQKQAKDIQETLNGVIKTQLQDSTCEFEHLNQQHSQTSELIFVLGKICELTDLFDDFTNSKNYWDCKVCATALTRIHSSLESIKKSYLCDIKVFKFLRQHFVLTLEGMKYNLDEKWMNSVSWILPSTDGSSNTTILRVPLIERDSDSNTDRLKEFQDFVYAMAMLDRLKPNVQRFSEMLMTYIFRPLIEDQAMVPEFDHDESVNQTFLKISLVKGPSHTATHSSPTRLFQRVVEILSHLHANLFRYKLVEGEDGTVMSVFSELLRDELLQLLVDKCLALTIPKSREELDNYKEVEDVVKRFESALVSINFIPPSGEERGSRLMAYVSNVSFHFANQRCTDILSQARCLMKKVNHSTQLVSDKNMGNFEQFLEKSTKISSDIVKLPVGTGFDSLKPRKLLSDDSLCFPECHVSSCAVDIMTLAYKTMYEASRSEPGCAIRLVTTTQHIFELYCTAYPVFHKDSLEKLPQQSAVFYNDCMYLAHHLLTFGHQFSTMSPLASKTLRLLTFVDKVPLLRRLGAECFLSQLRKQKDLMISCLEPLRTFTVQGQDKYNAAERAVKQILYQLNHLKKVWCEVLQDHTLLRALCNLVNSCIAELVLLVCALEDISADDSISLKLICQLVWDEVPILFRKEPDVKDLSWQKQVPKWSRLEELIFMLSASLREIVNRWTEGKGPLAAAFSITEVKGLIRALFQNTEHRAQAISKIRF